jgi:hypothetical protein
MGLFLVGGAQQSRSVHRGFVVEAGWLVVVVVGVILVVFVTSMLVEVACLVVDELVVFELDDDEDDDGDEEEVGEASLTLLWVELGVVAGIGAVDWAIPSVATCSSRTGG